MSDQDSLTTMNPVDLDDEQALDRILKSEKVQHRKIWPAKVVKVANGKADVDLLPVDVFLNPQGEKEPQKVRLTGLPICGLSVHDYLIYLPVAVGDEVHVVCSDRSVKPFYDEPEAKQTQVTDVKIHHFNGAEVWPIEISAVRLMDNPPTGKMVIGTKDDSAQIEIDKAGKITVTAGEIKLGSSGASDKVVLAGPQEDFNTQAALRLDALCTALGLIPSTFPAPLSPVSPVGADKVKAE